MVTREIFDQFTVYKSNESSSFIYADFDKPDTFMDGLSDYILREENLLNYAKAVGSLRFEPTPKMYKKVYSTLSMFLNDELELLTFDEVSDEVQDVLGEEYNFTDIDGKTLIQNDKIGKIGEYTFHLLLTNYYKLDCIIPKFKCTTDRNMSVFGIDALYYDTENDTLLFGESKVCKNIDNAITLVNKSLSDYEKQISEEYKLVLSNEFLSLSLNFVEAFTEHTEICISFDDFIKSAGIKKICIPVFLAHGVKNSTERVEDYLTKMNSKIKKDTYFGIETLYIFISLPIIDKNKFFDKMMKKIVRKNNEYTEKLQSI